MVPRKVRSTKFKEFTYCNLAIAPNDLRRAAVAKPQNLNGIALVSQEVKDQLRQSGIIERNPWMELYKNVKPWLEILKACQEGRKSALVYLGVMRTERLRLQRNQKRSPAKKKSK